MNDMPLNVEYMVDMVEPVQPSDNKGRNEQTKGDQDDNGGKEEENTETKTKKTEKAGGPSGGHIALFEYPLHASAEFIKHQSNDATMYLLYLRAVTRNFVSFAQLMPMVSFTTLNPSTRWMVNATRELLAMDPHPDAQVRVGSLSLSLSPSLSLSLSLLRTRTRESFSVPHTTTSPATRASLKLHRYP